MRYFIFFYKCASNQSSQYGEQGLVSEELPSSKHIRQCIGIHTGYNPSQCAILSFNEVSKQDYNIFFDKKSNGE
jgi:hypothetical protein